MKRVYRLGNFKWMVPAITRRWRNVEAEKMMLRRGSSCTRAKKLLSACRCAVYERQKASLLQPGVTDCFVSLKLKEAVSEAATLQKVTLFKQLLIESGHRNPKSVTNQALLMRPSISGGHRRGQIRNHELAPGALTAPV